MLGCYDLFFLSCVICFLCHSNGELIEWICIYSVLFNLWNSLRSIALTFLYISGNIPLWSHQVLVFRCVGNLKSNFTTQDWCSDYLFLPDSVLKGCIFLETRPFLLGCQTCCYNWSSYSHDFFLHFSDINCYFSL